MNGQRPFGAVLTFEAPLHVAKTDARRTTSFERLARRSRAGVLNDQGQMSLSVTSSFDPRANHHLAAALLVADPVLHRVLDERLEQQRWQANVAQPRGDVDGDAESMFEASALDIEIRLDEVELAAERRELAFRSENAAKQRREAEQRVERSGRCRLNQIA